MNLQIEPGRTETEQEAPSTAAVVTWLASSTRGALKALSETASRFHGDGIRYKAKLIGSDSVPRAEGDKMCWESMMKLKGIEATARRQGKHKKRVWLKISASGLKILDERTGAVLCDHDRTRICSLVKDESDPRALAYIYEHQDSYTLFYIKTATLVLDTVWKGLLEKAQPVLADIEQVRQGFEDQVTCQAPAEAPTQKNLLLVNGCSTPPTETSSKDELMEVFSIQAMVPNQSSYASPPESPQTTHSSPHTFPVYPPQPVGGSPYSSPIYPPPTMPWGQQGPQGHQWAGPAVAPWPALPGSLAACGPAGNIMPPVGWMAQAGGGNTPITPPPINPGNTTLNSLCGPAGGRVALQAAPPTVNQNLLL